MKNDLEKKFELETGEEVIYHPRTYIAWLEKLYDSEHRLRIAAEERFKAAEAFIAARIEMCKKNHICDAIELQRDFETFTAWKQSITNYNNAIQEAAHE